MRRAGRFQFSTDPRDNPKSLDDLLAIEPSDFHRCDVARLNLICASGLPGTEKLDIDRCIHTIDKWATKAEFEIKRHLYRVKDPRFASRWGGSQAKFSAEMLAQVLQEDCGAHYNPRRILDPDARNSKDLFIHGMIDDPNGGTCASMPALYTAVARRLRYPVKLVSANGHLFCRWDGKENRFNIESTGNGFSIFPDEYYHKWPIPLTEGQIRSGEFLTSMSPAEELSVFFASRAWCLEENGRVDEAVKAYETAIRLHPAFQANRAFLNALERKKQPILPDQVSVRGRIPSGVQLFNPMKAIR
jgi:hypothetical protein